MSVIQLHRITRREYLRLSDAMAEANQEKYRESDDGDGEPLVERNVSSRKLGGIRFQRCGGGRRVIRRQRGSTY